MADASSQVHSDPPRAACRKGAAIARPDFTVSNWEEGSGPRRMVHAERLPSRARPSIVQRGPAVHRRSTILRAASRQLAGVLALLILAHAAAIPVAAADPAPLLE